MHSDLFGQHLETSSDDRVALQNRQLVRVQLDGQLLARQGSMVAYQGAVDFAYEGAGGVGRFLKRALTGEGLPLMKCSGRGQLFLARDARELFVIHLEGDGLTVNADNLLAFDATLQWDIKRVEGVGMLAGGLFNTVLTGTGSVVLSAVGTPVVLDAGEAPTFADLQSAIAWSSSLRTSIRRTATAAALIGRGSGEAFQLAFDGEGYVVVQASEGPVVPTHAH